MDDKAMRWPYPTVRADGEASVDEDGETQTCECGNDTWTQDMRHATRDGRLQWMPDGSADPEEFAVCPLCGRVYSNDALFDAQGGTAPAIARYDVTNSAFIADLTRYGQDAYGDKP